MGGVYTSGWKILGGQGVLHQEQAVQPVGHPVHHEKGHGGADEGPLQRDLVPGGWGQLSAARFSVQGRGDRRNRHQRRLPAQAGLPHPDGQGPHHGDPGRCADPSDTLEPGPDSGGSLLRQRNLPHRGGYDGGQHGPRHEPLLPGGGLEEPGAAQILVRGHGRGE